MSKDRKVNLAKIVLIAAVTAAFNAPASAQEQQTDSKVYKCGIEKMELRELESGGLELKGKGLTALVTIHKPTGMYRESVDGWGSQHRTPKNALEAACMRLLQKAKTESEEVLRERLHEFYEEWK